MLVIAGSAIACGKAAGPAAPAVIYHIGDAIPLGGLVFTVNGVRFPASTTFTMPDPGKKFLGVDVTVKNAGEQRVNIFSRNLMVVKDSQGRQYTEDPTATSVAGTAPPDGDPFPGQQVRGVAGYQVADDATGFQLIVDTTIQNNKFLVGGPQGNRAVIALQ